MIIIPNDSNNDNNNHTMQTSHLWQIVLIKKESLIIDFAISFSWTTLIKKT